MDWPRHISLTFCRGKWLTFRYLFLKRQGFLQGH
jgi:hypothetical protein